MNRKEEIELEIAEAKADIAALEAAGIYTDDSMYQDYYVQRIAKLENDMNVFNRYGF